MSFLILIYLCSSPQSNQQLLLPLPLLSSLLDLSFNQTSAELQIHTASLSFLPMSSLPLSPAAAASEQASNSHPSPLSILFSHISFFFSASQTEQLSSQHHHHPFLSEAKPNRKPLLT
ncbi:hypothetical protein SETIT_9G486900v2 [Setaria italica]|uniref:Uncharacterized protein n=2 Tax=Setaria TaxID=4554 RepID=A0A368STW6_SETIT|nr:hypothetical protein SETIT_9G486900v2 [Setaria italica]TKV97389.1 hypothetical protein SEVIR_9G491000v2 [Setaria viridis]